jgi:hypothetical protein
MAARGLLLASKEKEPNYAKENLHAESLMCRFTFISNTQI